MLLGLLLHADKVLLLGSVFLHIFLSALEDEGLLGTASLV